MPRPRQSVRHTRDVTTLGHTKKTTTLFATALALTLAGLSGATAQEAGTMSLGFGLGGVVPKSDNGTILGGANTLDIGDSVRPTLTFEYFVANNIGIEVLGAVPFMHDIDASGLGRIGSTKHLPPVISVQYHFNGGEQFSPFVGVGLNYTAFFDETAKGAIAGHDLDLSDSWGVALHAGFDYKMSDHGAFRTDVRWIDIDSDVKLDGAKIGKAEIDPWVIGMSYVYSF